MSDLDYLPEDEHVYIRLRLPLRMQVQLQDLALDRKHHRNGPSTVTAIIQAACADYLEQHPLYQRPPSPPRPAARLTVEPPRPAPPEADDSDEEIGPNRAERRQRVKTAPANTPPRPRNKRSKAK